MQKKRPPSLVFFTSEIQSHHYLVGGKHQQGRKKLDKSTGLKTLHSIF
jgi:hypothetical protein